MHGCLRNPSNQSSYQSANLQLYFRAQPVTKQRNTPKPRIGGFSLCLHIGSMPARRRMKEWMRACIHTPLILNFVFLCSLLVEEWPDPLKLWVCHGSVSFLLDSTSSLPLPPLLKVDYDVTSKKVLFLKSVVKVLCCNHLTETFLWVLACNIISFAVFCKIK